MVAAVLALPAQAALDTLVSTACIDSAGGVFQQHSSASDAAAQCSFDVANPAHIGSGRAQVRLVAGPRRVGVDAQAQASSSLLNLPSAVLRADASGAITLTDSFQAVASDAQGRAVAEGFMDVDLLATGSLSFAGSAGALHANSGADLLYIFSLSPSGGGRDRHVTLQQPGQLNAQARLSERVHWVAGETVTLTLEVQARSSVFIQNVGQGRAEVQFGNSLDWLGVRGVTDLAGTPVAQFSLVSPDSGMDWAPLQAVPEPGAWQLLALGLAVAGLRRLRGAARG